MGVVRKFLKEKKNEQKLRRPNVYKELAQVAADINSKLPNILEKDLVEDQKQGEAG